MGKKELFTELSIKFAVLEAKVDKLLELAMNTDNPTYEVNHTVVNSLSQLLGQPGPWDCQDVTPHCIDGSGPCKCSDKLKVEPQSDNENFEDSYK